MKFIMVGIYIVLTLSGLVLMKLGGNPGALSFKNSDLMFSINWVSAIGFICYICSFLLFTRIVVKFDLSYILPIVTGIIQILTLIFAAIIFKEKFTIQSIIGAALVILGIIVMNFKSGK
ncbi:MAG: hypothetical protein RSA08_03410 [Clostridia bacterium]